MGSLGLPLAGFVAEVAIMIAFWMSFGWLVLASVNIDYYCSVLSNIYAEDYIRI